MQNNSRLLLMMAAAAALSGCASTPTASRTNTAKTVDASSQAGKATSADTQQPKGYSEAVSQGDAAWQAQDFDRAIYFYVQALDKTPSDAATLAKIGAIEDVRGNSALAERAFELAHRADPAEPHTAERLARLYLKAGKVDDAAVVYTQVLALDVSRSRALDGMGEVCLARADYGQAILYFDRALKAERPDASTVLTHRGFAKLHLRDLTGAETDLRSATSIPARADAWIAPRDDAWKYLGDVLVLRSDPAGALESLLKVMTTAEAYNEIGVVLMEAKEYQGAKNYFAKAIATSAGWFEAAQRNLALVDERLRQAGG